MYNPLSTYRIQFNKNFTFKDFINCIDYLARMGVGTIYASPIFKSVPGSIHGYDVTDAQAFNPEIGTEKEFNEIMGILKTFNLGWIQDIVPNHMAFHKDNEWLMDVLKKGRKSKYAEYFDISWTHPELDAKLLVPFLGKPLKEAIEQGEIKLNRQDSNWGFSYYDFFFPLDPETENNLVGENISKDETLKQINSDPLRIEELLSRQNYRLAQWQEASKHLNYRRFFTINSLISLAMEGEKVFEDYHSLILKLIREEKINGLRIDHIDGLKEPVRYTEKLRIISGDKIYLVAEKILQENEYMSDTWQLEGTTGYDFLEMVNNLFTYQKNYEVLKKFYQDFTGLNDLPEDIIYRKKKLILLSNKQGDLDNLCRMFEEGGFIAENDPELTREKIKGAITEFLVCFPRYKSYSWRFPLSDEDRNIVEYTIERAQMRSPSLKKILKVIRNLFIDQNGMTQGQVKSALQFFLRCMQYTGPLMAKGVEDTVMYYYNCFIAHNEVGDAVSASGMSVKDFHEEMLIRQKSFPLTQNTTSTHDTKRGEDVRARLNVISEIPGEWIKRVKHWKDLNEKFKIDLCEGKAPSANEEYFIYQTLAGIFPFDQKTDEVFLDRLDQYLIKCLREAKINSNWNEPNLEYEKSVLNFSRKILADSEFLKSFLPFEKKIAKCGIFNSLSQLYLKATCPGIPDFYQGTDLWDFSLVDPDNRRAVNYQKRAEILNHLIQLHQENSSEFYRQVYLKLENGHLKLWLTRILLKERILNPNTFSDGLYIPLNVTGNLKEHLLAFARNDEDRWYIVIIPLYVELIYEKQNSNFESLSIDWEDTAVEIPELAPGKWFLVEEGTIIISKGKILLSGIMENPFPCILKNIKETVL